MNYLYLYSELTLGRFDLFILMLYAIDVYFFYCSLKTLNVFTFHCTYFKASICESVLI